MKKSVFLLILLFISVSFLSAQDKTTGLKFDGVDDHVLIPHSAILNIGRSPFTIEAWIKADTNNNNTLAPMVLSKKGASSPSSDGILFGLKDNGTIALQIEGQSFSGGFGGGGGTPALDLRDNSCHHIAWTRETNGVEDTVNGYQDAAYVRKTRLAAGQLDISNNHDVWIGWSDFNPQPDIYQFSGIIKEVRIWNFAKTESQIFADRNKHLVGNETGLIAYWRLSENYGDTAYDCSGNDNHGEVLGATWATFCDILDTFPSSCVPDTTTPIDTTGDGIADADFRSSISISPNPTSGKLMINYSKNLNNTRIVLSDLSGRKVNSWNNLGKSEVEIEITGPVGMYFLKIIYRNQIATYKVLKE